MRLRVFLFAALAMPLVASCYDATIEGPEPVSTFSVSTSPAALNLRPDDVASFTVAVRNETRGQPVSAIGTFAESDAPLIARVETTSRPDSFKVTAVDGGTARIIVTYNGLNPTAKDTIIVTNAARPVDRVVLTPDPVAVFVGATATTRAALLDAAGDTIRQRAATFALETPGDTTIATVSATGVVTGVRVGTVRLIASREQKADTSTVNVTLRPVSTVTVTPADTTVRVGNTVQLTATLRAANNSVLTGRPITWASADTTIARVSSSGLVTGVAASSQFVAITATSEGRSGTARVIVIP